MTKEFLQQFEGLDEDAIAAILAEAQGDGDPAKKSTGDGKTGSGGKLFTQEEVNKIVSDRLAKERAKATPGPEDEREKDLKAREARLACRDYLDEKGLPKELLDALAPTDPDAFKTTLDRLTAAFPKAFAANGGESTFKGFRPGEANTTPSPGKDDNDALAVAFRSPNT